MAKRSKTDRTAMIPVERVEQHIYVIRGEKVLLDSELAKLYGVKVLRLNEAIKRNHERFPQDFMFQLTPEEHKSLISQFAISKKPGRGGRRFAPYVFTEHGAVMVAAVLNSSVAVAASIQVVRAFVRLRQLLASNESFRRKLAVMERKLEDHDEKFGAVFEAIRQLMDADEEEAGKPRIGFESEGENEVGM